MAIAEEVGRLLGNAITPQEYDDKALTKAQSLETFDTIHENELSRRQEEITDKKKEKKD